MILRFFLLLHLIIGAGCVQNQPLISLPVVITLPPPTADDTTPTPQPPVLHPDAIGSENLAENINPLTGETVADPESLNRRPIITKISNAPPIVRPQSGINAADLVFEHYAEGGLTRLSGVFYGELPERVGSIRSGRLIDNELVPMYQALLAYSGASNGVQEVYANSDFADRFYMGILYGQPYYWRDESIVVPHNLFVNLAAISRLATHEAINDRPDLRGMTFLQATPPNDHGDATAIDIRYIATRARWEYDAETGKYRRFSDAQPHYDANTMQQVTADNVVILFADHTFTDIAESEFQGNISYSIEIKLWFEGDAIVFRDGKRYEARWYRPTRESMLTLWTLDGEHLYLKPGNTWFQVVRPLDQQNPAEESITIE